MSVLFAKNLLVTITNGTALSPAVPLGRGTLIGILIPAAWTAANITFQASADDASFADVYDASGAELTLTVGGAARYITLDQKLFMGFANLKIRSGTTGTPVNQGADRILTLVTREL